MRLRLAAGGQGGVLVDGGGQDRLSADHSARRGWFRDSVLEFLPHPALGTQWNDVQLRACHGDPDLSQDGAWMTTTVRHGLRWGQLSTDIPQQPAYESEEA